MDSHDQSVQKQRPGLPLHEWLIVLLFCLILLTIAGFALGHSKLSLPKVKLLPIPDEITVLQVRIEGEVRKPGLYRLPLNSTVNDLLIQAEPLASADLSQLNWRRKLRDNQKVHIPERRLIKIHIQGAVEKPGVIEILSGTRCCHLVDMLPVLPNADLGGMRKKKSFVLEGDCVEVPARKGVRKKAKIRNLSP